MKIAHKIAAGFDAAASVYDEGASVQAQIARHLAAKAAPVLPPRTILDIGCGTGFAAEAAAKKWPLAHISALDPAPAMLIEALRKLPKLKTILGDAVHLDPSVKYDAIFSSMMLHWLPHPLETLQGWRKALNPEGRLYVALLTEHSFSEWHDLCRTRHAHDGFWKMPPAHFADTLASKREEKNFVATFPSARDFLRHLKSIGAATADPAHKPLKPGRMRELLRVAPQPFTATYHALFLEIDPESGV